MWPVQAEFTADPGSKSQDWKAWQPGLTDNQLSKWLNRTTFPGRSCRLPGWPVPEQNLLFHREELSPLSSSAASPHPTLSRNGVFVVSVHVTRSHRLSLGLLLLEEKGLLRCFLYQFLGEVLFFPFSRVTAP